MTRQLKEYKLSDPVKEYFENRGYKVYTEIPISGMCIDMVARKGNFLIAIELKMGLTKQLIHRCYTNQICCDLSYAAIPTEPIKKNKELCKKHAIGIIKIEHRAKIILEANNRRFKPFKPEHQRMLKYCSGVPWGGVGGLPQLKGIGPAIECAKRVKEYIINHPGAKWKEIFEKVHNHYYNYRSMQSALKEKI